MTSIGNKMVYDIYCYKPDLNTPSIDEAQKVILAENSRNQLSDSETRRVVKLIMALTRLTPKLESVYMENIHRIKNPEYSESNRIILNTPKGEASTQLEFYGRCVLISIPLGYSALGAEKTFQQIAEYILCIGDLTKYFVYDPQLEKAFDSRQEQFPTSNVLQKYSEMSNSLTIAAKPWWKIW